MNIFVVVRALFDDVSLQVNRGDRSGLVGPMEQANQPCFAVITIEVSLALLVSAKHFSGAR